jgi:hypothetical protein
MGTRCDFYVGRGQQAEWIGSYAFDGYPDGLTEGLLAAADIATYRDKVNEHLADGAAGTLPKDGWPWPWNDSRTTDYAYAFDGGKVWASCFGSEWFDPLKERPEDLKKTAEFPDMEHLKNVASGKRSGMICVSVFDGKLRIQ